MGAFGAFIPDQKGGDQDERLLSTSLDLDETLQVGQSIGDLLNFFAAWSSQKDHGGEIGCDRCF